MLDGRVAIVTGAGRGIGSEVSKLFASQGAKVVVNDLGGAVDGTGGESGPADETVSAIRDAGGDAVANYTSVADYDGAEGIIQQALDSYGRLDILVNVAGNLRDRMVFNMTEAEWDAVVAVHMKGTFNTTKYASIYWRANREGHYRLINFTSGSGLHGAPGQPNYAAAKLGIVGFTYSCANALGRYGVTSNAIGPGASTRMTDTVPQDRRSRGFDEDSETVVYPRRSPANVAVPLVYIASEASDWLNGQVIQAMGYDIGLYSQYEIIRNLSSTERWSVERAAEEIERVFKPAIEGSRLFG
jgi:NAD(P)-dependent dehydrogenase (short-subunit alcohol dehydrogenase family)